MNIFDWLRKNGYDYTWNFKLGGRAADIIAFTNSEIVAFEVKKSASEISTAVGQCMHYLEDANKSYIILPSKETEHITRSSIALLKKLGIGLLQNETGVKVILEAKAFPKSNKRIIEKLKEKSITGLRLNLRPAKEEVDKKIIEFLEKHPEGLTIVSIGKELNLHRNTVSKYIFGLVKEGIVNQRRIGVVSICSLSKGGKQR
jgi:predicted transcriptional regulator